MKIKWIKDLTVYFKLLFITKEKDIRDGPLVINISEHKKTTSSNSNTSIVPSSNQDSIIGGLEQEHKVFQRENDLVREGDWGYGPIVYEADMTTVRKESQYGYNDVEHNREDEMLADDIDLIPGAITSKTYKRKEDNTVDYAEGRKTKFDLHWEDIKRVVREDNGIDGIIKED